jgi:hypothetical protein
VKRFRDGFFPYQGGAIKKAFEALKTRRPPDLVFTHYRDDRHQDHRLISDLTWNTFRDHLILEYEIPKYDGDLGTPNCFVPLTRRTCARKIKHLQSAFGSQRGHWFGSDTFLGLMRSVRDGVPRRRWLRRSLLRQKITLQPPYFRGNRDER